MGNPKKSVTNPIKPISLDRDAHKFSPKRTGTATNDKANFTLHGKTVLHPDKPVPTVVTDKCDPLRTKLSGLELELKKTEKFLVEAEPGEKNPPKPALNPEWKKLSLQITNTRLSLKACEESLIPNTPIPLTLALIKFVCLDQSDEINIPFIGNTENDEPYALIFAVDLKTNLAPGASNSKMTLVGPLTNVEEGDEVQAPANTIWGLSNVADMVTSADNLIILVAMMENDDSSPSQVRTVLEKAAQASMLSNLPAFTTKQIPRQELVSRIVTGMDGAMGVAKVGLPGPDDNIGPIKELRFSQADLDHIYRNLGPIEKDLTFEGDNARYVLKFRMFG
ncbi:MAG: hypothetical protein ABI878_04785 [Acidobacteriota bacterium]